MLRRSAGPHGALRRTAGGDALPLDDTLIAGLRIEAVAAHCRRIEARLRSEAAAASAARAALPAMPAMPPMPPMPLLPPMPPMPSMTAAVAGVDV
jgi:hypothetical protein